MGDRAALFRAVEFSVEDFFGRATLVDLDGRKVKTLSPEDLLLVVCIHAAKHAWTRLCWLRDIAAVRQQQLNWDLVLERGGEFGDSGSECSSGETFARSECTGQGRGEAWQ